MTSTCRKPGNTRFASVEAEAEAPELENLRPCSEESIAGEAFECEGPSCGMGDPYKVLSETLRDLLVSGDANRVTTPAAEDSGAGMPRCPLYVDDDRRGQHVRRSGRSGRALRVSVDPTSERRRITS